MSTSIGSIYRVFRTTPWRDLLRGRMTRRLDWHRPIMLADLPEPIAALIERTVKRTRLTRIEKTDVARELVAHFQDAIREGASADDAAEQFGDEHTAARLITRAKKRTRHPLHKAFTRTCQALGVSVLLLIVVYAVEFVRFNTAKPNIARNYTAEYNAQIEAIPMDQRAWPIYKQAVLALHPLTDEQKASIGTAPHDPEWETQVALIADNQEALSLFRQAASRPHMGHRWSDVGDKEIFDAMCPGTGAEVPGTENPMIINILLPHLGEMRTAVNLLAAEALHFADQNNPARVSENLLAIIGMASHDAPTKMLIEQLIDMSMFAHACGTAGEVLWANPDLFLDDQLAELAHTIASYRGGDDIILSLESERMSWDDIVQRVYTDDGSGDGHLTPEGKRIASGPLRLLDGSYHITGMDTTTFLGPIHNHLLAGRKEMNAKYSELMTVMHEFARRPLCEQLRYPWGEPGGYMEFFAIDTRDTRYQLIHSLMPALDYAMKSGRSAEMYRDSTATLIALERFRLETGAYPSALDELVPQYLPAVPEDIFDCEPLRYSIREGRPFIYSVGYDQIDNNGEPYRAELGDSEPIGDPDPLRASKWGGKSDIDWVLFPPKSYWDAQITPGESDD